MPAVGKHRDLVQKRRQPVRLARDVDLAGLDHRGSGNQPLVFRAPGSDRLQSVEALAPELLQQRNSGRGILDEHGRYLVQLGKRAQLALELGKADLAAVDVEQIELSVFGLAPGGA